MNDDDVASPRCDECLTPFEVAGTVQRPYRFCASCGVVRLSRYVSVALSHQEWQV
jgi:hypothetical protein